MLPTINPHQFTTVIQALTDAETVYIVPNFQRPYAWEKKQIIDLLQDMTKANARSEGSHYLSALHLIPLDLSKADDPLAEFIDDKTNDDIQALQRLARDDRLKTTAGRGCASTRLWMANSDLLPCFFSPISTATLRGKRYRI
jgi:hypothetical protein